MHPTTSRIRAGFTLVELSIVLVIIGLLLGGVLIGKDMIRAAQLRSVITDAQGYLAAAQLFQDKYNCLPGDCPNATQFWSGVTNGNGNAQLDYTTTPSNPEEIYGAWQQLALAGFIKGRYSGVSGTAGGLDVILGTNVPAARLPGSGFTWRYVGVMSSHTQHYDGYYGNFLYFGAKAASSATLGDILTPAEAYQIDQKIDDTIPGTGVVRTYHGTYKPNCNTGTAATPSSSSYNVSSYTGTACMLMFISGW